MAGGLFELNDLEYNRAKAGFTAGEQEVNEVLPVKFTRFPLIQDLG